MNKLLTILKNRKVINAIITLITAIAFARIQGGSG